ncbi:MAG TPA: hypothetical protein VFU50_06770 [Terriglobales bacterium]|nr:hypothetical protein [Terriglobales bacterium]
MLAEWIVEPGPNDPVLEIPWRSEDGSVRFLDLKRQPELLLEIPEACTCEELASFLDWANSPDSQIETAKCDVWSTSEMDADDEVFGEAVKFSSYVDLLFASLARNSFPECERFVQTLARMLRQAPDLSSAAQFIVRRCLDHRQEGDASECFSITFYLHGYGADLQEAQQRWAIGLTLAQNAMKQYLRSAKV